MPEVEALRKQIRAAKRDGDVEKAAELQKKLRMLKRSVRDHRARQKQNEPDDDDDDDHDDDDDDEDHDGEDDD